MRNLLLLLFACSLSCSSCFRPIEGLDDATRRYDGEPPAFVGAEGFGSNTLAGRGGAIIVVDSLDPSGPGTLREALETPGPRTIVFEVGGIIKLNETIRITEPFVHVAGQTAPSPGINVFGAGLSVGTHDVVIRHIRVRPGDDPTGPDPESRDAIDVVGDKKGETEVFNVVIDHCSMSWATDEVGSTWYAGVRDITWSNNIIAEGLWDSIHPEQPHSKGLLIGAHSRRVAALRNLFAHNNDRNPSVGYDASALVVNNLIYDPGQFAMVVYTGGKSAPSLVTSIGNKMIRGPSTEEDTVEFRVTKKGGPDTRVYMRDSGTLESHFGAQTRIEDPPPVALSPLTILPSEELEAELLPSVGARPWDRDEVDARIVMEVEQRAGVGRPDEPEDVGGFPFLEPTERELELPENPQGDLDEDGFTNLDRWLREFER